MFRMILLAACVQVMLLHSSRGVAQTVEPVIAEYTNSASGSFVVRNSSRVPMAVVLEPKSFTISEKGEGRFRSLDPAIHLELSATSLRLDPLESATVFYRASADQVPAWLCIYASFAQVNRPDGMSVRVMLPHTIYLYGKQPLERSDVQVEAVSYDLQHRRVHVTLRNDGAAAARAESMEVSGHSGHQECAGFPLLPGSSREVEVDWTEPGMPRLVTVAFPRFTLRLALPAVE